MTRPITLVYQELRTLTPQTVEPDLDCLVLAAAYQILDYEDDKQNIEVSSYGTLNADNPLVPPVGGLPAITVAAPPGITAGAWVDPASIRVYFDDLRVILAEDTDGSTTINTNTLTSAGATFVTDGVQPGDTLIIDNPAGPATPSLVRTVRTVVSETVLTVSTNFLATTATLNYRVERTLQDTRIADGFITTPTFRSSNEVVILGGVTVAVDNIQRVVSYARVYVGYRAYRTDLQGMDSVSPNTAVTDIETKIGKIDARNPLAALVWVASQNAGQAPIYFFGVETDDLLGYTKARDAISSEKRVYAEVIGNPLLSINAMFKADNVTLADPNLALASGVPQKFRVSHGSVPLVLSEDIVADTYRGPGVGGVAEQIPGAIPAGQRTLQFASEQLMTAGVLPGDVVVLSHTFGGLWDGSRAVSHVNTESDIEVDSEFNPADFSLGNASYRIYRPSTGLDIVPFVDARGKLTRADVVYTSITAGTGVGADAQTIALVQDATTPNGIHSITSTITATTINADFASGLVLASAVVAALNTGAGVTVPFTGSTYMSASTTVPATPSIAAAAAALSTGTPGTSEITTDVLDAVYTIFYDNLATFLTDGVQPGDLFETPRNPQGAFTGQSVDAFVVNNVISEQRLEIQNIVAGAYVNNSSTVVNELPHNGSRTVAGGSDLFRMRYRVRRELTKDQQVDSMVAIAQSLRSQRALLQFPDSVLVSGLTDGSKPRNVDGTAAAADPQPGTFLSAVVGGMTAGLPNHQGFSRLGCAGIDRVYHSQGYFTERQLTQISEGGMYVFVQDTPESLPYTIHQLTTDPGALQTGEYSMVKNFDYLSKFFVTILDRFIGVWNVNEETLGFIRQALNSGISQLKLKRIARIGAPIIDAAVASLEISPASPDRVEIYMNVDRPTPLNVIGLHLIG